MTERLDTLGRDWARLGVLLACAPSTKTPDLERVLMETARLAPEHARLLPLAATWLVEHGGLVSPHRLARLVRAELDADAWAVLGLLIEEAVANGATRDLLLASEGCRARAEPGPLAIVQRDGGPLAAIARRHASEASVRWGVWAPPVVLRGDLLRPRSWVLRENAGSGEQTGR